MNFISKTKIFLLEVKTELKKATWPSLDEITGATGVVIVAIILVGVFIFFSDSIMQWLVYSEQGFRGLLK
jgi:preprotein translocase subunit SecE